MSEVKWRNVPSEYQAEWNTIFQNSHEGLRLSAPCPVCGSTSLHCYYRVGRLVANRPAFKARGGLWEWCSNCRCFEHYSCLVPEWWSCELVVAENKLTPYPTAIEQAIEQQMKS